MDNDIVLILGNGFDISLGLDSKFSDFSNSEFWPFVTTTDGLAGFLTHKIEEDPKWSDLEGALLEYASMSGYGSDDLFQIKRDKQHFQDLNSYFTAYLQVLQQKLNDINDLSPALIILNTICESKASSVIYSFNYTDLKTLVGKRIEKLPEIQNIHGQLHDYSIILGINDDAVVKPGYEFLYKSFSNYYASNKMQSAMRSAKEVIIFGHSLSQVDNLYFKDYLYDYLTAENNDRTNVTILTYNSPSAESIINNVVQYTGVDEKRIRERLHFVLTNEIGSSFWDVARRLGDMESTLDTSSCTIIPMVKEKRSLIFLEGEGFTKDYDLEKKPTPVSVTLKEEAGGFPGATCFLQTPLSENQILGCTDLLIFGIPTEQWGYYSIDKFLQNCMIASTNSIRKKITIVTENSVGKREILMKLKACCEDNLSLLYSRVDLIIFRLDGSDFHLLDDIKDTIAGKSIKKSKSSDIEALAMTFPTSFLPRIAEMQMTLARRYEYTTEYSKAHDHYLQAAESYLELETSSNISFTKERVSVMLAMGKLSIKYDKSEEVFQSLFLALDILPKLDEKNYLEFAPLRAECLLGIARMETRQRKYKLSIPRYNESIAIFRRLAGIYPDCFSPSLVEALIWYANLLCRQALDKRERKLFGSSGEMIHTSSEKDYRDKAELVYKEIRKIQESLYSDHPNVYAIPLAKTIFDIGIALLEKDWFVTGRDELFKAYALCKSAMEDKRKKYPDDKTNKILAYKRKHILPLWASIEANIARAEIAILSCYSSIEDPMSCPETNYPSYKSAYKHFVISIEFWEELADYEPQVYFEDFFRSLYDLFDLHENHLKMEEDSFALEYIERARSICFRSGNETSLYYKLTILIKHVAVIYDYANNKKARVYYEETVCMAYKLWKGDRKYSKLLEQNLNDLRRYYEEQNEEWRIELFKEFFKLQENELLE